MRVMRDDRDIRRKRGAHAMRDVPRYRPSAMRGKIAGKIQTMREGFAIEASV